jgi:hypothetical protein
MIESTRMIWLGYVARMLKGIPEGNRRLGRPRRRWYDIKVDVKEMVGRAETEVILLGI